MPVPPQIAGLVVAHPTPGRALILDDAGVRHVIDVDPPSTASIDTRVNLTLDDTGRVVDWVPALTPRPSRSLPRS